MGLTLTKVDSWIAGSKRHSVYTAAFDSAYPTGGEDLTAANLGLHVVSYADPRTTSGYSLEYDYANAKLMAFQVGEISATFTGTANVGTAGIVDDTDSAATVGHALYVVRNPGGAVMTVAAEASATGVLKDSDDAATNGVQIYLVIDDTEYLPGFQLGHLEFVSPTNAHGTCTVFNGGPTLLIADDDAAATNGVEVRAIAAGGGLEATIAGSNGTALVPLSDGQFLHIADSTTGSTPAIYFDEDASNTYERLQAVVVDNADEPYKLAEVTAVTERSGAFDSTRLASFVTVSPGDGLVSQGIVGVAGPEFDVLHDAAAAQMVGAAPLYVQAAGAGFNAALPGGEDVFIPVANGEFIKVAYAASPAGVQVYWDHNSANAHERMKAVVVDNADETYSTEAGIGWKRDTPAGTIATTVEAFTEVANGTNLSSVTARVYAIGD